MIVLSKKQVLVLEVAPTNPAGLFELSASVKQHNDNLTGGSYPMQVMRLVTQLLLAPASVDLSVRLFAIEYFSVGSLQKLAVAPVIHRLFEHTFLSEHLNGVELWQPSEQNHANSGIFNGTQYFLITIAIPGEFAFGHDAITTWEPQQTVDESSVRGLQLVSQFDNRVSPVEFRLDAFAPSLVPPVSSSSKLVGEWLFNSSATLTG